MHGLVMLLGISCEDCGEPFPTLRDPRRHYAEVTKITGR